jgi:hypothetical protein
MSVFVYDADGQDLAYTWQEDNDLTADGHVAISSPTAQTITWTAPETLPSNADGAVYSIYVIVQDEDGNQDWAFDEIWVYQDPVATTIERVVIDSDTTGSGCAGSNTEEAAAALLLPCIPLLGLVAWRRRRD